MRVETKSLQTADADSCRVTNEGAACESEQRIFARTWLRSIPRQLG
jgi:hypothetical protein